MPVDQSSLYGGYQKASRPRLPKRALETALSPYKITLASTKGKTDAQLRRMAAQAVIARRKGMRGGVPGMAQGKPAPAPVPVTAPTGMGTSATLAALKAAGLPQFVSAVPASARTSPAAFAAWVRTRG